MLGQITRQAMQRYADRCALIYGARRWSFRDLDDHVEALARGLCASGVRQGERILLFMGNRPELLMLQFAAERAGIVRVPLNARLTAREVQAIEADCSPSIVFHDGTTADRVSDLQTRRLCVDGEGWNGLFAHSHPLPALPAPDALASLNYTSGTTGAPKGVKMTNAQWVSVYGNMLIDRDIRGEDVVAHLNPLTHSSGHYVTPFLLRGATNLIVPPEEGLDGLLNAIEREGVTVFMCVPTLLTRLVNRPDALQRNYRSLRMIGYGAEPMPRNTLEKSLHLFGPILVQNYGLTEAMMTVATLPAADHLDHEGQPRIGCIGRPYSLVEVVLRAPDGTPVAQGEIGEITIRSPHVMHGYWNQPEATRAILRDGWLWSGDLATADTTGRLTLVGRSKDMLICGGFNIYPQEVEAVLTSMPGILEAAVIALPSVEWGEIPVAFVVPAAGSTFKGPELNEAGKRLLGIKSPKRWIVAPELPKNPNGKIDKKALRESLIAEDSR
jgi:acyl-CoA synthetase (AMP-forming)/AMP-acid ligase II